MRQTRRASAALAAAATLALSACGSEQEPQANTPGAKTGGALTAYNSAFPDFLDPALSYTGEGWQALWPVYTGLLTYPHAEGAGGAKVVPGLAEDLPEISDDGREYKLTLRDGLEYSDGSPVKASDFEHAIKRVLNLESGGSFFFEGIEGAADYIEGGKAEADIRGIDADDATREITIRLAEPDGQFTFALATTFAALVPQKAPFEPAGDRPIPGVGPYALDKIKSGRSFVLERARNFEPLPNVPAGKADEITVETVENAGRQAQDIVANKVDALLGPPGGDQLATVRDGTKGRYAEYTTNAVNYFFLNTKLPPFDDVKVRQAVATAVDERALARLSGGLQEPTCNFLPPAIAGYEKLDPCPWGDPEQPADTAKAKQLVTDAGAAGKEVVVYGDDSPGFSAGAEYLADLLGQIGFKAKPRLVSGSVYFQTIGNARTKAQAGVTGWSQDFPGAATFFQLIDGASIQPRNNINPGNVDDPQINADLEKANAIADQDQAAPIYAGIDRRLIEQALVLPYGHARATKITSARVAFDALVYHPVYGVDLVTLGLTG